MATPYLKLLASEPHNEQKKQLILKNGIFKKCNPRSHPLMGKGDEAREKAAVKAGADGDSALAVLIRQFQFKDIRPKAASEIELAHASRLLGHSNEEMTKKVYRRVGEIVKPTK